MRKRHVLHIGLLAALVLAGCGKQEAGQGAPGAGGQMPPPEVGVAVMQPAQVEVQRDLSGRLAAFRSADVRARVPGVLQRRLYVEGSDVGAGQALFQIDPAPLQASLSAAQAGLASAQAEAANARATASRARQLAPSKFISATDLDNALAAERSAAAAVQQAQAAVQTARINMGYATVRSPIAGRAGQQQVTEGALVGEGAATLLTTVDQIDPLYVEFSLGVDELSKLREMADGTTSREVQLCAQALCLEEMTSSAVPEGALFYAETKRRLTIPFDANLRYLTEQVIADLQVVFDSRDTPPPTVRRERCRACSLLELCRPDAVARPVKVWRSRMLEKLLAEEAVP